MTQPSLFDVEAPSAPARGGRPAATSTAANPAAAVGVPAAAGPLPRSNKKRAKTPPPADARATLACGPAWWALTFPAPAKLMSINTNKYWRTTNTAKKAWREAMYLHAVAAKLPKGLRRVRIDIELRFPAAGRRDAANYHPYVVKPIVDALGPGRQYQIRKGPRKGTTVVEPGHGLIPDDTDEYLDGPYPRIGEPVRDRLRLPFGQVVVTITDLSGAVA